MYQAGWKVEELSRLNEEGRRITVELKVVLQSVQVDLKVDKKHKVYKICMDLASFIKGESIVIWNYTIHVWLPSIYIGYFKHRRTAATHAYAILISPEDRKRKPYALPVQLIPYVGMGEEKIRRILNNLIQRMKDMGMTVAGTCV